MNQLNISYILLSLAFLVNLGLGLLVYSKKHPLSRINIIFAVLAWASASWVLSVLMVYTFKDESLRLLSVRMSFAFSAFIPASFLYFTLIFPNEQRILNTSNYFLSFYLHLFL
jgi:hypothetical protein